MESETLELWGSKATSQSVPAWDQLKVLKTKSVHFITVALSFREELVQTHFDWRAVASSHELAWSLRNCYVFTHCCMTGLKWWLTGFAKATEKPWKDSVKTEFEKRKEKTGSVMSAFLGPKQVWLGKIFALVRVMATSCLECFCSWQPCYLFGAELFFLSLHQYGEVQLAFINTNTLWSQQCRLLRWE